jgi:hypothetical protein
LELELMVLIAHAVYLTVGWFILDTGFNDPIFLLTGITRADQLKLTAFPFGAFFISGALIYAIRQAGFPDLKSEAFMTLVIFNLLTLNFLVASSPAITNEIPEAFWWRIVVYPIAVLGIQNLAISLMFKLVASKWMTLLVISILGTFNALALYLVLLELYSVQFLATQIYILVMLGTALAILMIITGSKRVRMNGAATVLTFAAVASLVNTGFMLSSARIAPNLAPFHKVKFSTKPDIHLISLDGLAPPKLIRKYLSLKKVPYEGVLSADNVHVFPNAFVSQSPTEPALNSVMRLAHADFLDGPFRRDYFSGHHDVPVSRIFRNNGYNVTTGSYSSALGMCGRYVSEYFPSPEMSFPLTALCLHKAPITFFGICGFAAWAEGHKKLPTVQEAQLAKLKSIGGDDPPQFTFYYIGLPGHAPGGFRSNDPAQLAAYAQSFYQNSLTANAYIKQVLKVIAARDRSSLVFLFGDHGAYVSKTVNQNDDPTFHAQDRYGVAAAILVNQTKCRVSDLNAYKGKGFITVDRILAGIIRCLSGDKAAFDRAQKFVEHLDLSRYGYD